MRSNAYHRGLHWFAIGVALWTLALVCVGGLVTSHGAGMAVPDWPTTYGYNMFFFPISLWTGGVFYEHTHRLVASVAGMLTIILAVWLWLKESRRWLRWLGIVAVLLVIVQGVLGGLRVTEMMDSLGIFHATLAQLFLVLMSAIALVTSPNWRKLTANRPEITHASKLRLAYGVTAGIILLQLIIGATMRHQHAGLAVPDFPLAYGKVWPDVSPAAIEHYNESRNELMALNPITAFQVVLHMIHRLVALCILVGVFLSVRWTFQNADRQSGLPRTALLWLGLIVVQVCLGAATVWTNKSADIATLHVAVGASSLVVGVFLWLRARQCHPSPATSFVANRMTEPQADAGSNQYQLPA